MTNSLDEHDRRTWRLLHLVTLGLLGLGGLAVVLIAVGTFDPRPYGRLWRTDTPGIRTLPATGAATFLQSAPWPTPPERFSVRLRAAYTDGQADNGYGLALGDSAGQLVVTVSPLGYVAVWQEMEGEPVYLLPWQMWPHVQSGAAENEIWLDVDTISDRSQVTARVNREQLWQGEIKRLSPQVALWLGSFDGPANVDFRALEWFAAP